MIFDDFTLNSADFICQNNNYLREIGENVTETEKIKFLSFILNRASYYLAYPSEQLLENNNLDILKKLDKLRRKIYY